jgi:glycosyltransferase involved in cell wall biosynthesis
MKISIITVCYNSAETIAATLRSVREQTYPDIEHIVIDGGSGDATLKVLASEGKHVTKVISEPDQGIYDAMNKGLAVTSGDVVGFLNSDDVLSHPAVIEKIVAVMSDPAVDACHGDLVYVAQHDTDKLVRYWRSRPYRSGLFERGWVPAHPSFYARAALYRQYGGFDLTFQLAADFDMLLRLLEIYKISSVYIPEVLVRMRLGGATNGTLRNVIKQNVEIWKVFRKYGQRVGLKPFAFKLMLRLSQFVYKPSIHG